MKTISPGILPAPRLLSAVAVSFLVAGCGGSTSPSYQLPGTSQTTRAQLFLQRLLSLTRRAPVSNLSTTRANHRSSSFRNVRRPFTWTLSEPQVPTVQTAVRLEQPSPLRRVRRWSSKSVAKAPSQAVGGLTGAAGAPKTRQRTTVRAVATQAMSAKVATVWRSASWWRAAAVPQAAAAAAVSAEAAAEYRTAAMAEIRNAAAVVPTPVAAAPSPREASAANGLTAAGWEKGATAWATASIFRLHLVFYTIGAEAAAAATTVGVAAPTAGQVVAGRVTRVNREQRVPAKRRERR